MELNHELTHETWTEYFDAASRELLNAPVSIETETPHGQPQIQVDRLPLALLTYDRRDDLFEVAAIRGGALVPGVIRHLVEHPRRIVVDAAVLVAPVTIVVDGGDGVRTLIKIERPDDVAD